MVAKPAARLVYVRLSATFRVMTATTAIQGQGRHAHDVLGHDSQLCYFYIMVIVFGVFDFGIRIVGVVIKACSQSSTAMQYF
jgi:hypothetical protein